MAFISTKLSLMVGADGASWYRYVSTVDALAAISAANYFGPVANILNPGDMIVVNDSANLNQILFIKTSNGLSGSAGTATTAAGFATPAAMTVDEGPTGATGTAHPAEVGAMHEDGGAKHNAPNARHKT
jgi:hypothetical protein